MTSRDTISLWDDEARTVGREPRVLVLDDPALWGGPITDERYAVVC